MMPNLTTRPFLGAESRFNVFFVVVISVVLSANTGCVALNLPSDRFYDPADDGGFLGDWRTKSLDPIGNLACGPAGTGSECGPANGRSSDGASCHGATCHCGAGCSTGAGCLLGEALDIDPFDTSRGEFAKVEEPEIPWPRYHPVPTRPVFGGP